MNYMENNPIKDVIGFTHAPCHNDALAMMELSVYDWAACAIAGQNEPLSKILADEVKSNGGRCESTYVGGGLGPAAGAALVNGTMSHALDYDDTHFGHIGHTSVAVVPAALAMAQKYRCNWHAFIEAALIGSEAAVRIGQWLGREHYQVGFHQTATSGAFGACIAALRLAGADEEQTRNGIGLVASMASGLKAQFGTMAKPLNAGLAAQAGVDAAQWAMAGMTATDDGLLAFAATHHGQFDQTAFHELGTEWRMLDVSHKFHACCHGLHAMCEALGQSKRQVGDIESITVFTHPRWLTVCNQPAPDTGLGVKFSFAHVAAMVLTGVDTSAIASFSNDVATNDHLVALRQKVSVISDPDLSEMQSRVITNGQGAEVLFHDLAARLPLDIRRERLQSKADGLIGAERRDALWQINDLTDFATLLGSA